MTLYPRNIVLLVIAAVLGAITFFGGESGPVARSVAPLVPEFDAESARVVRIMGPGGEAITTLERSSADAPWTLRERYGAPALGRRVAGLLTDVGALTDLDLVGEGAERFDEYGLTDERAHRIRVETDDGTVGAGGVDLYLSSAGEGAAFVRRATDDRIVRAPRFPRFGLERFDPRLWLETGSIVPLGARQIAGVRATGSALSSPFVARHPRGDFTVFEDALERRLPGQAANAYFELLGTLFPLDALRPLDEAEQPSDDVPLDLEVTPSIGEPFRVVFTSLGQVGEDEPGIGFHEGGRVVYSFDPEQLRRVVKAIEDLRPR